MTARLPPHAPGMRIGLFGGTFNPPHAGHVLVSEIALRRLGLDRVWWLVTPGNPLKQNSGLPPLAERISAAKNLTRDPRIVVSGLEAGIGTRYTFDTIEYLSKRARGVNFVWLMGADNLAQFSRWQRWRDIAALVPIAAIDRPGATRAAFASRAAQRFAKWREPESRARTFADLPAPAFVFLHDRRIDLSSTLLRRNGKATQGN
jgi:nicotinate-nucleotide adenylyltransferase